MDLNPTHPDHLADSCWFLLMAAHHWRFNFQPGGTDFLVAGAAMREWSFPFILSNLKSSGLANC